MLNQFVVKINALYYGCLDFFEGCSALALPVCVLCDKCCNLGQGFRMNSTRVTPRVAWERVGGVFDLSDLLKNLYELRSKRIGCVIKVSQYQLPQSAEHRENQIRTKKTVSDFESFNSCLFLASLRFGNCLARVQKFHKLLQIVVVTCQLPVKRESGTELEL